MSAFGDLGAVPGTAFASREEIRSGGLHRHGMRGISGGPDDGADAIVLSGGYADDLDLGDEIVYTGEGGRDSATGLQVADQTMTGGNAGLVTSQLEGHPVRVFRGSGLPSPFAPSAAVPARPER